MSRAALACFAFLAVVAHAAAGEPISIFNGKDLQGWEGDPKIWTVEGSAITGATSKGGSLKQNTFLIWRGGTVKNFELRAKVRLTGDNNSGIQYRSRHLKDAGDFVVGGYQADIHPSPAYNGMLYEERGRGIVAEHGQKVIIDPQGNRWVQALGKPAAVKLSEWNEYTIIARGNHLIHKLNGKTTVEVIDYQTPQRALEGILALQVHAGPPMKVQFKDIQLTKLPDAAPPEFDASVIPAGARKIPAAGTKAKKKIAAPTQRATADEPLPCWIWHGEKGTAGQVVFFRKTFSAPEKIRSAKLYASCDDEMIIFVNGQQAARGDAWQTPVYADVTASIRPGENVVAVRGKNHQSGFAGLVLKLVLEGADGGLQVIATDDSWRVSAKAPKVWRLPKFDDSSWAKATVVGRLGDAPWSVVNRASLARAAQQPEPKATFLDQLKVAKDFKVEQVYSVPRAQGSWVSMTVDPSGRLIASDQYGKLYRMTLPGGKSEQVKVEAIPVDLGEAQGLLWAFDALYVVVNRGMKYRSGLYRVRDTDGDDQLDKVELLRALDGGGEHGPHAVLLSPDGKSLFVVCGNHTNLTKFDSYRVPKLWGEDSLLPRMWDASGHAVGRMAPGGWIARTDPEGKSWELFCAGFRNQYDAAFNRDGELFTYDSDMEWDMNTPWYRPTRVYHCVSGAEFSWRGATAKFPPYYPDTLPPALDVGPGSPTGVVFGYGAKFPAKYQEALYICDWSYGKLYAVHLTPDGASYKGTLEEFIKGTPLPLTDIVINPKDGAMYFAVGGRKAGSAVYRVTYTGRESTAPSKGDAKGAEERALRRKLEGFHGKKDANAIAAAWPYLSHKDRFIRWAARTAIEHQEPTLWWEKALEEKEPQAALEALLALARSAVPGAEAYELQQKSLREKDPHAALRMWIAQRYPQAVAVQPRLLGALDRLDWKQLSRAQQLALLRVYGLAFIRMGPPEEKAAQRLVARFDALYPANDREMNAELCKLLVYLQAPSAAAKTMALLRRALTQEEQMEYALSLRNLKRGWDKGLREEYFRWFLKAATYKGGHSFGGFIRNIRSEAVANLSPEEKVALKPILDIPLKSDQPVKSEQRPFVKNWTLEETLKLIEVKGLKGRNFAQGRKMFAAANCFACHRFANEGGATGPDLTGVAGRFNARDILEAIIDPNKVISDQYQAVVIASEDGRVVTGRIVNLAGDSIMVNTDMLDPNKQVSVNRRTIQSITPSPVSMMPAGLLNTLNEDEVLDLLAYLLSGGNPQHAMFRRD